MDEKEITYKSALVSGQNADEKDLKLINKYALRELKDEEVFTFKAVLCDNEVDRDFEVFPLKSLERLSSLYVGKTMIMDHERKSANQCARIYATEVVPKSGTTKNGETYHQLVARCYMVRADSTKDFILQIDAGIKKEISVGCRIKKFSCSICGTDNRKAFCEHYPGKSYNGSVCYFKLEDPDAALEASFVAVPAQPRAGTTKEFDEAKSLIMQKNLDIRFRSQKLFSYLEEELTYE